NLIRLKLPDHFLYAEQLSLLSSLQHLRHLHNVYIESESDLLSLRLLSQLETLEIGHTDGTTLDSLSDCTFEQFVSSFPHLYELSWSDLFERLTASQLNLMF